MFTVYKLQTASLAYPLHAHSHLSQLTILKTYPMVCSSSFDPFLYAPSLLLLRAHHPFPRLSPCLAPPFPCSPNSLHPISSTFPSHWSCIPLHLAFLRHVMVPPTLQSMSLGPEQPKKSTVIIQIISFFRITSKALN